MLLKKKHQESITNIITKRGPDSNSDHYMVGVRMKQIISIHGRIKYGKLEILERKECKERIQKGTGE